MILLSGQQLFTMASAAAFAIGDRRAEINDLNVFPVPDGDTGTNMEATMEGGVAAAQLCDVDDAGSIAQALSDGMLLSARGNSGVILSQFFAGFAKPMSNVIALDVPTFQRGLESGVRKAYEVVVKPTEGTMLTVLREATAAADEAAYEGADFGPYFEILVHAMRKSLENTPELLPVLKEAGVVDSGGTGVLTIFEAMAEIAGGKALELFDKKEKAESPALRDLSAFNEDSHLDYGYCTEFLLQLTKEKRDPELFSTKEFISFLQNHGDSIVCFQSGTIVKTHIHTKTPDIVISKAIQYGDFVSFKMENMALQHNEVVARRELVAKNGAKKHTAVAAVAVSPTKEIGELFRSYGVSVVLESSDLMNPSGKAFLDAFAEANADSIIVFPNNKNELLVAQQAAALQQEARVEVIGTYDVPTGLAAASVMELTSLSLEDNLARIHAELGKVISLGISKAFRDAKVEGLKIRKGDCLGFLNGKVVVSSSEFSSCWEALLEKVEDFDDLSVLNVVYGKNATEEQRSFVHDIAIEKNDFLEIYSFEGGQELFLLYATVE